MDKIVIPGRILTKFFLEKFYSMEITDKMLVDARGSEMEGQTEKTIP